MSRVFISYSRKDSEFALKLAHDLRAQKIEIWIDQLDIPAGKPWDDEIEKALDSSTHFLLILSKASVESPNVKDELAVALDDGKTIVPVLLEDCRLPLRIRRLQHIDVKSDYASAVKKLVVILGNSEIHEPHPPNFMTRIRETREDILHPTVLIESFSAEDGILAISLNVFASLRSILDTVWFRYLKDDYKPFTYGIDWILISQNLPIPIALGSWDWFVKIEELLSMHKLNMSWDRSDPTEYGMKIGSQWKIINLKDKQVWRGIYAVVSNDKSLADTLLSGEQGSIKNLLASNRLIKTYIDTDSYLFKYLLYDETKELGGQVFKIPET